MAQELKVLVRPGAGATVLELHGDVTMYAEAELTRAYRAASERGGRGGQAAPDGPARVAPAAEGEPPAIVLNFGHTEYINSAGIAIIISLLTEARAAGVTLVICCLSAHYQKIFRMVGLTQYADIYADEAAALDGVTARLGVS